MLNYVIKICNKATRDNLYDLYFLHYHLTYLVNIFNGLMFILSPHIHWLSPNVDNTGRKSSRDLTGYLHTFGM